MTYDLRRELDALGADERAAAPDLAVDGLATRAHRRRAMRAAATSAVAVVAVGAITVAAVALPRWTTPPPVTTPSPSPTATAFPPQEWTAVTADGEFACGEPVPRIIDPEGEADLHFEVVARTSSGLVQALHAGEQLTVTEGELFGVGAVLVNGTDHELAGQVSSKPLAAWIAQDGAFVGLSGGPLGGVVTYEYRWPVDLVVPAGGRAPEEVAGGLLVPCAPHTDVVQVPDGPPYLAAGDYQLFVTETVYPQPAVDEADAEPSLGLGDSLATVTVVGGPYALTVEAAVDPHPALEDLVISTSGLGPLTVGLPPATNPGAAMIEHDDDYCAIAVGEPWQPAWGDPGQWVPSGYELVPGVWSDYLRNAFELDATDEMVNRIDIHSPLLRTAGGIGIGSTLTELQAAHPGVVDMSEFDGGSRVWVLQDSAGVLVFETAPAGYLPEMTEETITSIRITPAGLDFPRHTLGTGDVAANCGLT